MDHSASGIAAATAMTPLGDGRWATTVDEGWSIAGRPNGGYLLALLARAACAQTGRDLPLGVSAVFVRPPELRSAVMVVETVRSGRTVSAVRVRLEQDGVPCAEALVSTGEAAAFTAAPLWSGAGPVELPPVEACVPAVPRLPDGTPVPLYDAMDVRLDPACVGWFSGRPAGVPEMRAWVRERAGARPSPLTVVVAVDVRSAPAPGWLVMRARAHLVADGWFDESVDVWDSTGRLVGQARQLARTGRDARTP